MKAKRLFEPEVDLTTSKKHIGAMLKLKQASLPHHAVLVATDLIATTKIPTAATDGVYVYVNPDFYRGLANDSQRAFLLAHEVSHIMRRHPQRAMAFDKHGFMGKRFNRRTYNIAGDYIINHDGETLGLEPIPEGCYSDKYTRDDLIETVYSELVQDSDEPESGDSQDNGEPDESGDQSEGGSGDSNDAESDDSGDPMGDPSDDGEGSENGSDPLPDGHGGHDLHLDPCYEGDEQEIERAMREDEKAVRDAVDRGIDEAVERKQDVPEYVKQCGSAWASVDAHTDWISELSDLLIRLGEGGESTYNRIHRRRYSTLGVISPTRKGSVRQIANVIDVSSSVDRGQLNKFMSEQASLIDQIKPTEGVVVVFTNHAVVGVHEVMTGAELLDLDVPDGGGTRMAAGLEWLEENGFEPDLTMVFTDGELFGDDWAQIAKRDAVAVTDRVMPTYDQREADRAGVRVIAAAD